APLSARAAADGAGAALPASRGAHADDPRLDRADRRPHPQALPFLPRRRAARDAAASGQVATPDRLLQPLAAPAGGTRGARAHPVAARGGTVRARAANPGLARRTHARRAAVP